MVNVISPTFQGKGRCLVLICDYHMHLERDDYYDACRFNLERISLYVQSAAAHGVAEIGITEHCNRFAEFRPFMSHLLQIGNETPDCLIWRERSFRETLDTYVDALLEAKAAGLPVKVSLEVDFIPEYVEQIRSLLAQYPWDYVLGSVHFLGSWGIDMDANYGWPEADVDAVYRDYFSTLAAAASSGLFHVLAHADLVKKFGHTPSYPLDDMYEMVAKAAKQADVAVEISTAGLHKPVGEMYPAPTFLKVFHAHGVPITLASDAHEPQHIGQDFDKAIGFAHEVGYRQLAVFDQGQRRLVDLG